jgi:hypothetical protein
MITGSQNLMFRGVNELEVVGGFERTNYGGGNPNAGGDISQLVGKGYAIIGDQLNEGAGNITEFVGRSLWFTGVGDITVYMPGITAAPQALGNSPLQNNIPQVVVLNQTKNGYTSPFQVGLLDQLTAPTLLVATTPVLSKLNGTYSVQLTWFRDGTGGESLPSPPSNVVQFSNQTGLLNFPPPTNSANPRDRWRVFVTPSGFGAIGGYFFLTEVPERRVLTETGAGYAVESVVGFNAFRLNPNPTGFFSSEQIGKRLIFRDVSNVILHTATVTSVITNTFTIKGVTYGDRITFSPAYSGALSNTTHNWSIDSTVDGTNLRQINIEWFDNELIAVSPPIDAFPPATTASFIAALSNVMILIGTEEGLGIAVSVPNFPEAYPPDFRQNLSETPVGVLSRPQDGFLYVLCENSVHELRWTGAVTGSPISVRPVSNQVGAASQRAACQAGDDIYLFTKSKIPARILANGIIDISFGDRVEALMKTWDSSKVSLTFDEKKGYIAYCHNMTMLLYYPARDAWSAPIDITSIEAAGRPTGGSISSAFTLGGLPHISFYEIRVIANLQTTATSATVTNAQPVFDPTDVGRFIRIPTAGPAGAEVFAKIITFNTQFSVVTDTVMTNSVTVSATIEGFSLFTFDRNMSNVDLTYVADWKARFAFTDYGKEIEAKTLTKAVIGMKSSNTVHTMRFFRNYKLSAQMGADKTFTALAPTGDHINNIVDLNHGEGQLISTELSGSSSRAKIYFIQVEGFTSGIRANFGV